MLADTVVIEPDVDTWVMQQPEVVVPYEGDVVIGQPLPPDVQVLEVPKYKQYGFVTVKKKRVLIDMGTRKVIKVY